MKHRIKNFVSLIVALSMLLSLIPLYSTALDDEFEGMETLEEVPFTFELEPGDLPWEELESAVLAASDIPACIDSALAEARGHVNRLYQQEPDDYTVMFQNRDGSKTIYVFSYPVKNSGTSVSTTAAIQVNNGVIVFSGNNIITSRIGVDIKDYSIGYCEIQTLSSGILTSDGVNITEDARGWARGESSASNLVYNMSSGAAAEYNMSVSSNATVAAAVTPGITITPIDPIPSGGVTVMAISYSTLTGLMSFKNMSTEQFLTLTTSSSPSLTTSSSIVNLYSRWLVQYDAEWGYTLSNSSNIPNTFLGKYAGQSTLSIGSRSELDYVFGVTIVSTEDSTLLISDSSQAITSDGSLVTRSWALTAAPASCQWQITSKTDVTLVSEIGVTPTRVEQSGADFYLDYNIEPSNPTMYEISLYYADTDSEVAHYSEPSDGDEYAYYINTPGVYGVYYMDSITGIKSENFLLIVQSSLLSFGERMTYSIRPFSAPTQYLSMSGSSVDENGNNSIGVSAITCNTTTSAKTTIANSTATTYITNHYERWNNISKLFTFEQVAGIDSTYKISAILCTEQATIPTGTISASDYSGPDYDLRDETLVPNTICYSDTDVQTKKRTDEDTDTQIIVCNMGTYYVLLCYNKFDSTDATIKALKYFAGDVSIAEYSATDTSFHWYISHVGVNAPLIMQTRNNSCGYTNVLQVLYGKGEEDVAVGNDLDEKIEYIAQEYGTRTYPAYSNSVYSNIKTELIPTLSLNSTQYSINHPDPDAESVAMNSKEDMIIKIERSLDLGWAPMILTYTGYAPYKEGWNPSFAHYVCIIGYDENSDTIIISNCHYTYDPTSTIENDKLFGVFAIDADDFYAAVAYLYVMS